MDSTIVIKVKYEKTLRRFNASVVSGRLVLDIEGLRAKVRHLFNLASDADFTLRYTDEDGDVVTLADEEDLLDVVKQSLNPLRITAKLNTEKSVKKHSSGSSTPTVSPQTQHPLNEVLKSVPAPLLEAASKLSKNLYSKHKNSAQSRSELVDMGVSFLKQFVDFQAGAESSPKSGGDSGSKATTESIPAGSNSKNGGASGSKATAGSNSKNDGASGSKASAESSPKSCGASGSNPNLSVNTKDSSKLEVGPSANSDPGVIKSREWFQKAGLFDAKGSNLEVVPSANYYSELNRLPKAWLLRRKGLNLEGGASANSISGVTNMRDQLQKAGLVDLPPPLDLNVKAPDDRFAGMPNALSDKNEEKKSNKYPSGGMSVGDSSGSHVGPDRVSECPFSENVATGNYSGYPPLSHYAPQWAPYTGFSNPSDGPRSIIHRGVGCDGCGTHPIAGTRFKSLVKHDYDLCSICFAKERNHRDYIRIDWPVEPLRKHLPSLNTIQRLRLRQAPLPPHVSTGAGMKRGDPKLDSCFIQDVNILDGTIMSPSTAFTKIWRLKNNGTTVWPRGTHLMWIGGDRFSNTVSVELEIPKDGLPVGEEVDVAIDFCAPELPGRYISYWRMALHGQKFGQRVWVLIQVDTSLTDPQLPRDPQLLNTHSFNLNLPPTNSINGPQIVNVNVEPIVKNNSPAAEPERSSNKDTELVEQLVDAYTNKDQELNFPINDTLLVGGGASNPSSTVSYPVVDLSKVEPITHCTSPSATNLPVPATLTKVEQKLLRDLEEMGFKQADLNKEILRKNEYNLQQSVDDLCGVEEWDPILDELKEMGFCDDEVNKRLLKKNNGSIKGVVMDLINGE